MKHMCNQVVDPGACCPVAHGAQESQCTCPNFHRIAVSLPGATLEGYARELIRAIKAGIGTDVWSWEKVFQNWDAYQIGQMYKP